MTHVMPFRLLDLPAELRNRVYDLSIDEICTTLRDFQLPPLTQVCKQVRSEVVQIAAAKTKLTVRIGAYFRMDEGNARPAKSGQAEFEIEHFLTDRLVADFTNSFGNDLYFRDIHWIVHDLLPKYTANPYFSTQDLLIPKWFEVLSSDMTLHKGERDSKEVQFSNLRKYPLPGHDGPPDLLGVDKGVDTLVASARSITNRDGFEGYTVQNLRMIQNAVDAASRR